MLIEIKNITKHFPLGKSLLREPGHFIHALDNVNLSIHKGRTLALVGESGSGKTTLGKIIAGLINPTSGEVLFEGQNITEHESIEPRNWRRQLQIIFQDPYASLNPRHNVRRTLSRPFVVHTDHTRKEIDIKIKDLLTSVGMTPPEQTMVRYPHQFSGGQRQRLVIARAIALQPKFIIADEPVSALDMSVKAQLLNLMRKFQSELNLTYLFITHELSVVRTIAQDIAVMYLGEIVEQGPARELFVRPFHPYSKALLAATPGLDPRKRVQKKDTLKGDIPSNIEPPSGCRFHTRCPYAEDICQQKAPSTRYIGERRVACHFVGRPGFPLTENIPLSDRDMAVKGTIGNPR
ncbi:MAG: ATP-binding cassette domain-containing protein [Anaerolineales bacterium]